MDPGFWAQRWRKNEIAFHQGKANALLVKHFNDTLGKRGHRVFVPLCGKTRDLDWLRSKGYSVAGVELSETAIKQLFAELGVEPEISELGNLTLFSATGIDIFVGDIFDLSTSVLGQVDVIYDRAALVALPETMRQRYADHLMQITETAPQFLITYEYDQTRMDGPPFSVTGREITRCYGDRYALTRRACVDVAGGLKGKCAATENVWILHTD
jgi:thiopurine S-methyltransferase